MAGLFGVLFTLVYMVQYRRKHWWNIGYTYNVPRLLAPLYGSLLIFVIGLALHAYLSQNIVSRWVTLVWGALALFFLFRTIQEIWDALQSGWDSVLVDPEEDEESAPGLPIWSSSVIVLLLSNLLLLGWWGTTELNAGTLTLPWVARLGVNNLQTTQSMPTALPHQSRSKLTSQGQVIAPVKATQSNTAMTTVLETRPLTATLAPAVSTLDARTLQVTPTPATSLSSPTNLLVLTTSVAPAVTATMQLILVPTPVVAATAPVATGASITVQGPTGANVRTAPALSADVIALLPTAGIAPVLERTADNQWFLIQLPDGVQGWIAEQVVVVNGSLDRVPITATQ